MVELADARDSKSVAVKSEAARSLVPQHMKKAPPWETVIITAFHGGAFLGPEALLLPRPPELGNRTRLPSQHPRLGPRPLPAGAGVFQITMQLTGNLS